MPVFKINNLKLSEVKDVSFPLEKELQDITEKNLDNIFNFESPRVHSPQLCCGQ